MALSITAYSKLKETMSYTMDEYGQLLDEKQWFVQPNLINITEKTWPGRTNGVKSGVVYNIEEEYTFTAGTYSGYGIWRDDLAKLAGYPNAEYVWHNVHIGPFVELINFSDCEGVIGSIVAKKLAKDFVDFANHASIFRDVGTHHVYDRWHLLYTQWQKAFNLAADNGAICFS